MTTMKVKEHKKRYKKCVIKNLKFEDYKICLQESKPKNKINYLEKRIHRI